MMYGRYNLNSLKGIINTINALHERQIIMNGQLNKKNLTLEKMTSMQ